MADSVADAIAAEVAEMKAGMESGKKRFWHLTTSAKGLIYVRFLDEKVVPSEVVKAVVKSVEEKGQIVSRFCLRLVPLDRASSCSMENLEKVPNTCNESTRIDRRSSLHADDERVPASPCLEETHHGATTRLVNSHLIRSCCW